VESLYQLIKNDAVNWRQDNYLFEYVELKEILNYQWIDDNKTTLRYLRMPQFEAIEVYCLLRFVKNTSHIIDIYKSYHSKANDLLKALNIQLEQEDLVDIFNDGGVDALFTRIKQDDAFVKKYKLENLKETLSLDYPSYIFALVMGAGKTILIGTIIYIEFALSLVTNNDIFLRNALVFAPGKTILGSLKEISLIDFEKILPKRFASVLATNLKITYTRDGDKNIPVINGSSYNIIITNIEKIRILSKHKKVDFFNRTPNKSQEEKENFVNLRLSTIASLQNLGVFSDEAHNTYGQQLNVQIKKVRQTIDYLHKNTDLKVVINTTGTPYIKNQILKDVVFWYGLLEGIEQNILKDIRGNINSYSQVQGEEFIAQVLKDFFTEYKDIPIAGGNQSKIAIYFPKIEDVTQIKPFIEKEISKFGLDANTVFVVNTKSSEQDKDTFINRVNDKDLPYRIFLLVGMGKEGWNCPSLFACCLARELGNSNNFVLQAATRCLRQLPENTLPARLYLSQKNTKILDTQLQQNYGQNISQFNDSKNRLTEQTITLVKYDTLPKIKVQRTVKKYTKKEAEITDIKINQPNVENQEVGKLIKYDFSKIKQGKLTETEIINLKATIEQKISLYIVVNQLSTIYDIDSIVLLSKLQQFYPDNCITKEEVIALKLQIEQQTNNYEVTEQVIEEWLTIIKAQGFDESINDEGVKVYTTTITVHKDKLDQLLKNQKDYKNIGDLSFHYNPYKFDSQLEISLFDWVLEQIDECKENIRDFLFVGGITDRSKTDLVFEYRDEKGRLRNYTPDFLILKGNGKFIFLETKGKHLVEDFKIKEKFLKKYLHEQLKYELLVSESNLIAEKDKQYLFKIIKKIRQ